MRVILIIVSSWMLHGTSSLRRDAPSQSPKPGILSPKRQNQHNEDFTLVGPSWKTSETVHSFRRDSVLEAVPLTTVPCSLHPSP